MLQVEYPIHTKLKVTHKTKKVALISLKALEGLPNSSEALNVAHKARIKTPNSYKASLGVTKFQTVTNAILKSSRSPSVSLYSLKIPRGATTSTYDPIGTLEYLLRRYPNQTRLQLEYSTDSSNSRFQEVLTNQPRL